MPKDKISKNLIADGWTIRHDDGTTSRLTKNLFGDGYTIRHQSGAQARVTRNFMSDDWTVHLPDGGKLTISQGFLSENWSIHGPGGRATASKDFLSDNWTITHNQSRSVFNPATPPAKPPPIQILDPLPIATAQGVAVGSLIDARLSSFASAATDDGSECRYLKEVWRVSSIGNAANKTVSTPLAITTTRLCWQGLEIHEERGVFRTRREERRRVERLDISRVSGAEVSKGAWWPQVPLYDLSLHGSGVFFSIQDPEAVSLLREVVGVLASLGIETHDRHDIFWAGGGDPHYRPPLEN